MTTGTPEHGEVSRADVEAVLETRAELGPAYEAALVESFAERIEAAIQTRVDARIAEEKHRRRRDEDRSSKQLAMGITSLALGIPISAIAGGIADLPGLVVSWAGIVGVNAAYAWQNRSRRKVS